MTMSNSDSRKRDEEARAAHNAVSGQTTAQRIEAVRNSHTVAIEFDGWGDFPTLKFSCHEDGTTDPFCWMVCPRDECEEGCVNGDMHVRENTGECQVVAWLNGSDDIGCDVINDRTSFAGIPIGFQWTGDGIAWAFADSHLAATLASTLDEGECERDECSDYRFQAAHSGQWQALYEGLAGKVRELADSESDYVLLTERCVERNCGTRVRYGELTDDANTHWHVRKGVALVAGVRTTALRALLAGEADR